MFRSSFISLFILVVFSLFSQDETNGELPPNTKKYFIGISTSALLNVYPALQISHEYALNTKFRIGLETGYIFSRFSEYNVKNVRGFRLRPTVKYSIQNGENDFFSFLIFYNYRYTTAEQQREIWRPTGAYSEFIRGTRTTIFNGPGIGFDKGFLMKEWFFRFGFGVGAGKIRNDYDPPELQNEPGLFVFSNIFNELQGTAPIWYFNLCFGLL